MRRPGAHRRAGDVPRVVRPGRVEGAAAQVPAQRGRGRGGEFVPDALGDEPPVPDAELVARVRGGDDSAFAELYRRHAPAVRRYARSCCRDAHTAEDLTGEVFARTLQAVRGGRGPESAVRAYLLTTVRRTAARWSDTARHEQLVEDFAVFAASAVGVAADTTAAGADVRAMREADGSLAMRAFRTLPERWQAVLWHTAVEEETPRQIAPLLGLTPNATAVLAHRAREGLRQAYLQAHASDALTARRECARFADRLGAHARGGLRLRADRELRKHLAECGHCRRAAAEIADINALLHGVLPVSVIGWFAATYAAKAAVVVASATTGGAAASGAVTGTGGAGGSGGTAGGAVAGGLGTPVKAAVAAGVVVTAAGVALAAALLAGGDHRPAPRAKAAAPPTARRAPAAVPPAPARTAPAPPAATPGPPPPPARHASLPRPAAPATAPEPPSAPAPRPSRTAVPAPPPPRVAPSTPPVRPPQPPPGSPPPVRVYDVGRLPFAGLGSGDGPEVVPSPLSLYWPRQALALGGVPFADGVSVRVPSAVTVRLNRACRSFDAVVGPDRLSPGAGAVRFLVYGDGTLLAATGPVRPSSAGVPVHAALTGRRSVRLVVEGGVVGGLLEEADWADPRVVCP